jgi:hypothetical protein
MRFSIISPGDNLGVPVCSESQAIIQLAQPIVINNKDMVEHD